MRLRREQTPASLPRRFHWARDELVERRLENVELRTALWMMARDYLASEGRADTAPSYMVNAYLSRVKR